jgi:polar amino acid transport system substrate-binding protein
MLSSNYRGARMRWRLVMGACACVLACGQALAKETITLCFERQEVLPWRTLDHKGLNFELLDEVALRLNIVFDYQSMPWKRCLEQLKDNQVGGAFALSFSRDRLTLGAYPGGDEPDTAKRMHVDRYVLVRRKGGRIDWDGRAFRNVDGAIGVQLGYSVGDFLRHQNVPVDEGSQRASELAQKLIAGRVVAAALGGGDAANLMKSPLSAQLEVLPMPLVEKPYYLVLSRALATANPQMAGRIWKTIEQVRSSPAYQKRLREDFEGGHH